MQSNRTTPSRVAGTGTSILLLLLGILLILAALYYCLSQIRPNIEADLDSRVTGSLQEIGLADENVLVTGQDVMLAGVVPSDAIRKQAEQRAIDTYGVARVYNNLRIDGEEATSTPANTEQTTAAESTDTSVAATQPATETTEPAGNDLVVDESLSPSTLDIVVTDGRATVQGIVPDEASIERIIDAVSGKFGVANVEDDMSTYVGSAKPRWLDGAVAMIDQIDDIENPSIKITHSGATLGGTVSSETLGQQKAELAKRLLGQYLEVETDFQQQSPSSDLPTPQVQPRTPNKRPASLKISNSEGGQIVSGTVSSDREANAIRNSVARLFQGNYQDNLNVDETVAAADWIDEAIAVTDNIQSLDNFSVSINSGQMLLSGEVSDRISGRSLASAAAEITNGKLSVVNNFAPKATAPIAISGEELLAQELQKELNALNTAAIVFEKGSTTLTNDAKTVLNQVADVIMSYSGQVVEIAGHTDSSGDALANLELSRRRAIAVQEYLVDRQVPQSRLSPIGYGETDPIADNLSPEGQAANRRIEFKL